MWHVTCDTWTVWGGERSLKISAPWLLLFVIYDTELINDEAVYRTAPATLGLTEGILSKTLLAVFANQ